MRRSGGTFSALASAALFLAAPALAGAAPRPAAPGCTSGLQVALDPGFLEPRSDLPPVAPARIEAFRQAAGQAFRAAADEMCARGTLRANRLRGFTTLLVQSGSGATETAIYVPDEGSRRTLVFQWIFAEAGLALPGKADIQAGIRCWANPRARACDGREP